MEWKAITNTLGTPVYILWKEGKELMRIVKKSKPNTYTLELSDGTRRVINIKDKGLFKKKTVLCNEYGAALGALVKLSDKEQVEIDSHVFDVIRDEQAGDITILDSVHQTAITSIHLNKNEYSSNKNLLMILYYYIVNSLQPTPEMQLS